MIWGITLLVLSIIAVPSLLLSKRPNAAELLARIEPYQGGVGLLFCFWGMWGIISAILNIGWLTTAPIWWITLLTGNIVSALLGFMLGLGLINRLFLSKSDSAFVTSEQLRKKIAPKQGMLGIAGILLGSWMIAASFLFSIR